MNLPCATSSPIERTDLYSLAQQALRAVGAAVSIVDLQAPDQPMVFVNEAFCRLTGYTASQVLGRNCRFLQHPDVDPAALAALRQAIAQRTAVRTVLRNRRRDGSDFWNALQLMPLAPQGEQVTHFFGFQQDLSEWSLSAHAVLAIDEQGPGAAWARFEQAVANALREQAATPQRHVLLALRSAGAASASPTALSLPQRVSTSARLRPLLTSGAALHFTTPDGLALLAPLPEGQTAGMLAVRVLGLLRPVWPCVASVAELQTDGHNAYTLMAVAQAASLRATSLSANGQADGLCFADAQRDASDWRTRQLLSDLAGALAAQQFRLVFQPIVELASGTLSGFEALLRWRHPTLGEAMPGEFIAQLEHGPEIAAVTRWILQHALKHLARWDALRDRPLALPVVFLTAFGGDDSLDRARQTDPFGYILKPFSERELRTVLEIALHRHRTEARMREGNERFRTLVEWTPEASVVHRHGHVVYANPAALRMCGAATPEELLGRPVLAMIHPDCHAEQLERVRCISAGMAIAPMVETRLIKLDGSIIDAEVQGTSIDFDGEAAVYVVMRDVTARKAAEAQLRKLSLAVEQSTQSILITDCEGRIEYVNQAFERITGYRSADRLGRHPSFLGCDSNPEESIAGLWATLRSGESWHGELINRRTDGSTYTALLTAVPLRQSNGRITHYLQLHDDISEQKRLAAELDVHRNHLEEQVASRTAELAVARQQADAANQAKTAFLANMSHEIRTPMNAIIGINELLRRDPATPEQAQRMGQIAQASQHLLAIINDVLDLSKIEAGKVLLEDLPFHLSAVLDNVASIIGESARCKGLVVEMDTDSVPMWLRGDPTRLRQALLNYAGNAVKFTTQGKIVLRAQLLDDSADGLQVRFEVEDTGAGIAAHTLPLLFSDFEQADASTTRQFGCIGLGLAITGRLARLMGGEAGVDSQVGVGSTFWFTAWLHRSPDQGGSSATASHPGKPAAAADLASLVRQRHAAARVLLAEDNEVNRELAVYWLQDLNLNVEIAVDGREALQRAQAGTYALVLMDMQMPNLDGMQATQAIRALPRLAIHTHPGHDRQRLRRQPPLVRSGRHERFHHQAGDAGRVARRAVAAAARTTHLTCPCTARDHRRVAPNGLSTPPAAATCSPPARPWSQSRRGILRMRRGRGWP